MIALLNNLEFWHWFGLGFALLFAEAFRASGYLRCMSIAALLVGVILIWIPISGPLQWSSFGVFSLTLTWLWWRRSAQL